MIPVELNEQVQTTVLHYFAGERQEMLLIVGGSLLFSALSLWLWWATRTNFAATFALTVIATAILFSATALSLSVRDRGLSASLVYALDTPQQGTMLAVERERIAVVVSKYPYYRHASGVITLIALLGLALSSRDWVHGLAAGLLLLVVAQVLIDHYSERRATHHLNRLDAYAAELASSAS
ncbi:hypothetical protein JZM63_05445 [Aeromonas caviae]|uniref:hypothetical protein n=1 Tax=Aeromonas TaxID=642 RepID=UPI0006717102|nr:MULTISPECIES: hypothetical protein [Aeromonas]KMY26265.1 hypothetical protein ACH48_20610 [Aeromonas caviae]MBL0499233.1 hypothetical protein [Aeromonas caviae]MCK0186018.1 hypothetical protein [Aeromonas hydrophila]MCR3938922.1 hypothetical protein [Aeromonas caviae]QSO23912.1 hypothetical protein JZM63_05445 [Aeromonas caviae]